MPKPPTPARQRAIGLIGAGHVGTLEKHGLAVAYAAELARLYQEIAELERRVKTLRAVALETLEETSQ